MRVQHPVFPSGRPPQYSGKYQPDPPERGPFGLAEIWLKPDTKLVSKPPYRLLGQRERELTTDAEITGKFEDGKGPWNTPCFQVPKKNGKFRLV